MTDFTIAHVADGEARALAEAVAAQLRDIDGHNLGFLYVTNQLAGALDEIVKILKARSCISNWVGTVGLGICATGTEYFDRPAIAALTGRFADGAYRMIASISDPNEIASTVDAAFVAGLEKRAPGLQLDWFRKGVGKFIVVLTYGDKGEFKSGAAQLANAGFPLN